VSASRWAKAETANRVGEKALPGAHKGRLRCVELPKLAGRRAVSTTPKPHRDKPGGKDMAAELIAEGKGLLEGAQAEEARQLTLLGPPSPEEMELARERLGPNAGNLSVLAEARRGRGRPKGSRNRRTKDFRNFMLAHGRHPALTLMEIQNTPPEVLVERSKAMDPEKRKLSYGDAQALRTRCAEALMPFMESKMPVAVELGVDGDFNLIIPGLNVSLEDAAAAAAGSFVLEADYDEVDEGDAE
jgi:hypothetical protein